MDKLERLPVCTCGELKPGCGHKDRCPTLTSLVDANGKPKIAPVQGYVAGIPWSIQLRAYDAYCAKWSSQTAMIDLDRRGCRGGFGVEELDDFVPGWRDEVSEITRLKGEVERLTEALADLRTWAAVLHQNSVGCAENHHGADLERFGMPGWLDDAGASISRATDLLARSSGKAGSDD